MYLAVLTFVMAAKWEVVLTFWRRWCLTKLNRASPFQPIEQSISILIHEKKKSGKSATKPPTALDKNIHLIPLPFNRLFKWQYPKECSKNFHTATYIINSEFGSIYSWAWSDHRQFHQSSFPTKAQFLKNNQSEQSKLLCNSTIQFYK